MIRYIVTSIVVSCATICSAAAQNIDRVLVKDGSVYEGYISKQTPGREITVKTECATLFVDSGVVTELVYTTRDVKDLSERLGEWVRKNRPDAKTLQVASLKVAGKPYKDVVVLESGVRIKMLSFADDTFDLDWKTVVKTAKTEEWLKNAVAINDVVTLKDGKYFVGHVIEQIIGYELRIRSLSGEVNAVRFSDILSIRSEQTDMAKSLWKQIVMLDRVELKNGTSIEGFITSRVMGRHLTMVTRNDAMEKEIPLKDVAKYVKVYNDGRKDNGSGKVETKRDSRSVESRERRRTEPVAESRTDTDSNEGAEVYMNGLPMTLNSVVLCDGNLNVVKNPVKDKVSAGTEIKIEMPASFSSPDMKIVSTQMRPVAMMSSGNGSNAFPTYNKRDIDKSYIDYGTSYSDNGNVVLSIVITVPGIYVLIPLQDNDKCIVFEVIG